ncbi:hypothetical protein K1719_001067 [Acacia pycnantha]|nr:hypothetical protein K1719_001067 [Acacia pycnantha]
MNHKCDEHEALVTVHDIEAKPTVTTADDDDFEPRPTITSYNNDDLGDQRKGATENFELRPSITSYSNGNFDVSVHLLQKLEKNPGTRFAIFSEIQTTSLYQYHRGGMG